MARDWKKGLPAEMRFLLDALGTFSSIAAHEIDTYKGVLLTLPSISYQSWIIRI
jgi:hypothetical protein